MKYEKSYTSLFLVAQSNDYIRFECIDDNKSFYNINLHHKKNRLLPLTIKETGTTIIRCTKEIGPDELHIKHPLSLF